MSRFSLLPFRVAALSLMLAGLWVIADARAQGPATLWGFAMFCLGIAILDGLFRGRFGFRQVAIFLSPMAVALGLWVVIASSLLRLLELPEATELRAMLIASAACMAGSAGAALLAARSSGVRSGILSRMRRAGRFLLGLVIRPGEPRVDPQFAASPQWRPAGPMQGG